MTDYIVLKQEDLVSRGGADGPVLGGWVVVEGSSLREAAVKNGEGTYVRVPARSFKPVVAKVEQATKVTLA